MSVVVVVFSLEPAKWLVVVKIGSCAASAELATATMATATMATTTRIVTQFVEREVSKENITLRLKRQKKSTSGIPPTSEIRNSARW